MLANSPISDLAMVGGVIIGYGCLVVLVAWTIQRWVRLSPRGMVNLAMIGTGLLAFWIAFDLTTSQFYVRREIAASVDKFGADGLTVHRTGPLITRWSNFDFRNENGSVNLNPGGSISGYVDVEVEMALGMTGFTLVLAAPIAWLMVRRRRRRASSTRAIQDDEPSR